ncbi:MAG: hypothetical protein M9894_16280 [Planctomycetes bacterium]|nr:hypothetical protein [Planctomycetota bacterium]
MSDARMRELERAARAGHVPEEERIAALLRAGAAPDPRWDPRPHAEVAAARGTARREVLALWPRRLVAGPLGGTRGMVARPTWGDDLITLDEHDLLPFGTPILNVMIWERSDVPEPGLPITWRVFAAPSRPHGITWVDLVVYQEPLTEADPALEVEQVEWRHIAGTSPRARRARPQRCSIYTWRRWARGGRVLALGEAAP